MEKNITKSNQLEKIELTLIIDEDNFTIIEIDLKNVSDQEIHNICSSICLKYHLSISIKKKLFNQILKEINQILKLREKDLEKDVKEQELVNRLYYDAIDHKYKKLNQIENLKKEIKEKYIKNMSFTPIINYNKEYLKDRKHYKIEERLYYEYNEIKERKKYKRILSDIASREGSPTLRKRKQIKKNSENSKDNKSANLISSKIDELNKDKNTLNEKKLQEKELIIENNFINGVANNINKTQNEEMDNSIKTPGFISKSQIKNNVKNIPNPVNMNVSISQPNLKSSPISNYQINYQKSIDFNNLVATFGSTNFNLNNLNHRSNKINFLHSNSKSSFPIQTNSYSEKYEKILNQKNQQNSINVTINQALPITTQTPTSKNDDIILEKGVVKHVQETKNIESNLNKDIIKKLQSNSNKFYDTLDSDFTLIYKKEEINKKKNSESNKIKEKNLLITPNKLKFDKNYSRSLSTNKKLNISNQYVTIEPNLNRNRHERLIKELKMKYTFRPEVSNETNKIIAKIRKPEDQNEFVNRLSNYNKIKSLTLGSKFINLTNSFSHSHSTKNIYSVCNTSLNILQKSKQTLNQKKSLFDVQDTDGQQIYIRTTVESDDKHKKHKSRKMSIRELKSERKLFGDFHKVKEQKVMSNKIFHQKFMENINKFKLNNLKQIYESIIQNKNDLNVEGIPNHVRDKVIIPTCSIIKNRQLEFNFHNFYTIANEILNNFF